MSELKIILTGKVTATDDNSELPYANVYFSDEAGTKLAGQSTNTLTNNSGDYKLEAPLTVMQLAAGPVALPPSKFLTANFGSFFKPKTIQIKSNKDVYNFALAPAAQMLPEVTITAEKPKPADSAPDPDPIEAPAPAKKEKKKLSKLQKVLLIAGGALALTLIIFAVSQKTKKK